MKKILTILILMLSINLYAQRHNKAKLKLLKIAHITAELDLTEKEAQVFWPIYNANEEARDKLRSKHFRGPKGDDSNNLTEAEAKVFLDNMIKMEEKRLKLQKTYYAKLQTILTSKKIMNLMHADRSFKKKLIKEWKMRHRK